jgi:CRP-like cAMP-binding protein
MENEIIFVEGDMGDCMFWVEEGCVQIYSEKTGAVYHTQTGGFFGEVSLVVGSPRNASAR